MKYVVWALVAVIVLGGVWYVVENRSETVPSSDTSLSEGDDLTSGSAGDQSPADAGMVQEVVVNGDNFKFDPKEIRVKEGTTVRVVFNNTTGTHDWVIDEFNARTKILKSGESETVEFVANKKGSFEYYCSVGEHRAMGMVGNLIVE